MVEPRLSENNVIMRIYELIQSGFNEQFLGIIMGIIAVIYMLFMLAKGVIMLILLLVSVYIARKVKGAFKVNFGQAKGGFGSSEEIKDAEFKVNEEKGEKK